LLGAEASGFVCKLLLSEVSKDVFIGQYPVELASFACGKVDRQGIAYAPYERGLCKSRRLRIACHGVLENCARPTAAL
jgi:hypothetical protein